MFLGALLQCGSSWLLKTSDELAGTICMIWFNSFFPFFNENGETELELSVFAPEHVGVGGNTAGREVPVFCRPPSSPSPPRLLRTNPEARKPMRPEHSSLSPQCDSFPVPSPLLWIFSSSWRTNVSPWS